MALEDVKTQMLIRRPAREVYEAFVDPAVTTKFWFTRGSGRLEPDGKAQWHWDMYGFSANVEVKALDPSKRIEIEWSNGHRQSVEWLFEPRGDAATLVLIKVWGFTGSDDEVVAQAVNAVKGFTLVLAGAKAWLEHGVQLNLVADHHPDGNKSA